MNISNVITKSVYDINIRESQKLCNISSISAFVPKSELMEVLINGVL